MYLFFTLVLLFALVVAFAVVARKFPQLSNVDLAVLPEERARQRKRELFRVRLDAEAVALKSRWRVWCAPIGRIWIKLQFKFRQYVGRVERLWHHEQRVKDRGARFAVRSPIAAQVSAKVEDLLAHAEALLEQKKYEPAEEQFIAVIKLDQTVAAAYRGLADSYAARGALEEARETYRFVLKLEPDDDSVMGKLAEIAESQGDLEEAIQYLESAVLVNDALSPRFYHLAELLLKVGQPLVAIEAIQSALALEPKNPRFLDLLIETAILAGDKDAAEPAYQELRLANPDNQKLMEFKERIQRL